MAGGVCKACSTKIGKMQRLCEDCAKLCSKCRAHPRTSPASSYCRDCKSKAAFARRRQKKSCRVCGSQNVEPRKQICAPCRELCSDCRKVPHTPGCPLCSECNKARQIAIQRKREKEPGYYEKRRLQERIRHQILRGKQKREPCVICNSEPSYIFVKKARKDQLISFFLCRTHYDAYSGRNGTKPW